MNKILSNPEVLILLTAAMPISELRGAIPLGFFLGQPISKIILLSILGNLLPVAPLLILLKPISKRLRHIKPTKRFFEWLFERTKKKANLVEKYESLGLVLFVAIPLPMTGAWTGCVAASLFRIRFRYAFLAITIGVFIAATAVTLLSLTGAIVYRAIQ